MDIEKIVSCTSDAERTALVRQMLAVLCEGEEEADADTLQTVTEILIGLVENLDTETRAELSKQAATSTRVPEALAHQFACDRVQVARPVLKHSPVLSDKTLVEIVTDAGIEHAKAVATRSTLSETVADAVIGLGSQPAMVLLAKNRGARLSPAGVKLLARIASTSPAIAEALCSREDLPEEIDTKIVKSIEVRLHSELGITAKDLRRDQIRTVMQTNDIEAVSESSDGLELSHAAFLEIAKLERKGELNETALTTFLVERKFPHAMCTFAHMARIGRAIACQLLLNPYGPSLAIAARAVPLEATTYRTLVTAFAELVESVDEKAITECCNAFEKTPIREARQIMNIHDRRRTSPNAKQHAAEPEATLQVQMPSKVSWYVH